MELPILVNLTNFEAFFLWLFTILLYIIISLVITFKKTASLIINVFLLFEYEFYLIFYHLLSIKINGVL